MPRTQRRRMPSQRTIRTMTKLWQTENLKTKMFLKTFPTTMPRNQRKRECRLTAAGWLPVFLAGSSLQLHQP